MYMESFSESLGVAEPFSLAGGRRRRRSRVRRSRRHRSRAGRRHRRSARRRTRHRRRRR